MEGNGRFYILRTLVNREIKSTFNGFGFYLVLSISLLISTLVLKEYLQTIETNGILVSQDLLNYPLYFSVLTGSLYLVLTSTITITKEREEGTLQTLFFTPVDEISYVLGKYFQQMICYIIFIFILLVYIGLSSVIISLSIPPDTIKLFFLLVCAGSCIISLGILVSSMVKSIKISVILFLGIMLLFSFLEFSDIFFIRINLQQEVSMAMLYFRDAIEVVRSIVRLISPISILQVGFEVVRVGDSILYKFNLLFSIIYSIFLIIMAILALRHRGVTNK